jgi:hypothetical protein
MPVAIELAGTGADTGRTGLATGKEVVGSIITRILDFIAGIEAVGFKAFLKDDGLGREGQAASDRNGGKESPEFRWL